MKAMRHADDDNEGFLSHLRITQKNLGSLVDGEDVKESSLTARQLQHSRCHLKIFETASARP